MKQSTVIPTEPRSETLDKPRQPYAPPEATFVPLKPEERLAAFGKHPSQCHGSPHYS